MKKTPNDFLKKNLRHDILKEMFNIGVGKAADILSDIVNKKIVLSVPDLAYWNGDDSSFKVEEYIPERINGTLMVSSISFDKEINGKANLIFSASKMKEFVRLCMGNDDLYTPLVSEREDKIKDYEFNDIDYDIIREVGNIVLNCILGETGNLLHVNLNYSLPEIKLFDIVDLNKDVKHEGYSHIFILHITFLIGDTEIEGAIIIDLTVNSLAQIISRVDDIEVGLYE